MTIRPRRKLLSILTTLPKPPEPCKNCGKDLPTPRLWGEYCDEFCEREATVRINLPPMEGSVVLNGHLFIQVDGAQLGQYTRHVRSDHENYVMTVPLIDQREWRWRGELVAFRLGATNPYRYFMRRDLPTILAREQICRHRWIEGLRQEVCSNCRAIRVTSTAERVPGFCEQCGSSNLFRSRHNALQTICDDCRHTSIETDDDL